MQETRFLSYSNSRQKTPKLQKQTNPPQLLRTKTAASFSRGLHAARDGNVPSHCPAPPHSATGPRGPRHARGDACRGRGRRRPAPQVGAEPGGGPAGPGPSGGERGTPRTQLPCAQRQNMVSASPRGPAFLPHTRCTSSWPTSDMTGWRRRPPGPGGRGGAGEGGGYGSRCPCAGEGPGRAGLLAELRRRRSLFSYSPAGASASCVARRARGAWGGLGRG